MKIINPFLKFLIFLKLICISVTISLRGRNKQLPVADNKYRQANVPPVIAVLMDIPAYGKTELYKWNDFIQANTIKIYENRKKNAEALNTIYTNRLKRMGLMRAKLR